MNAVVQRLKANPQLVLFLVGTALLGVSGTVTNTIFNNYLDATFNMAANVRGNLEFPRELPGFLTALFAGLLFFLPETRVAFFCALTIGLGMLGLSLGGGQWYGMLVFMVIWSAGMHLLMPVSSSLGMALAKGNEHGKRLGQIYGVSLAASILGFGLVWVCMRLLGMSYRSMFMIGAIISFAAAWFFYAMRVPEAHLARPKFAWNRQYWLYYVLVSLYGARKQIFITFGPWVLIKMYSQQPQAFAVLGLIGAVLGLVIQPWLGRLIDRLGERVVLTAEGVIVAVICLGYAFAPLLPGDVQLWKSTASTALIVLFVCFLLDGLSMGVNMARSTYLRKIAVNVQDVSPALASGVTIDHVVSMAVPTLGGLAWMAWGYWSVFLFAAGIALVTSFFGLMIRVPTSNESARTPS